MLRLLGQQVEHVGDHDRVPRTLRQVTRIDRLERHVGLTRLQPSSGLFRFGDLGAVDVDPHDATLRRLEAQIQRHQSVSAADLEHVAALRHRSSDHRERTPPPSQTGVQARRARCVREQFDRSYVS